MAHIPDGVLSAPVLIGGAVVTAAAVTLATRRLDYDRIPQAAVLAATFFVASLVSVPVGASSVHLVLSGLMGILLGWTAVPTILIALLLQAVFFGYGGLLVLGVNTLNIALPALLCGAVFRPLIIGAGDRKLFAAGAAAGALATALTGALVCLMLVMSGSEYLPVSKIVLVTYLPLILVEAAVTGAALSFICRVSPQLLEPERA